GIPVELARVKAERVLESLSLGGASASAPGPDAKSLVVGADTIVEIDGRVLGKPDGRADARRMLERLSGRVHRVHTGGAVFGPPGRPAPPAMSPAPPRVELETSEVTFRVLSAEEIEAYLDTGDFEGKAGAYGIQSEGGGLVAGFRGCYYNVVGLPVKRLT